MPPPVRLRYRFADLVLSPARRSLRRGGHDVPLIPRYLDLLILLVERRDVALHRREIFDRVWADVVVSDGALSQAIRTLRRALGEDADRPFIRTVSRHGYRFVCPVAEEEDDGPDPAAADAPETPIPAEGALANGDAAPMDLAHARLRLERAGRLAGSRWASASAGGAAAGALAGLLGGLAMAALGGPADLSLLGSLALVGAIVAGIGAAGVGFGLAAAEAIVRSGRTPALAVLGAAGGGLVGFVSGRMVSGLVAALFGLDRPAIGGGLEGLCLGAAAGLGFGLATRRTVDGAAAPRGRGRLVAVAATAVACALAGAALSSGGGRLGAASLDAIVGGFPSTRVRLAAIGRLFGESGLGPRSRTALGFGEGLLFGAGLAAGLARRSNRVAGS
ncbi:MAG TPA: winged helix-turn-helix domain-containing protein [Vicinamibacteria bacterium]|nr:winged helix-turn-helix domain-containing protein [Vicinamibacteria bacterium]